jgi:hypothetical protein
MTQAVVQAVFLACLPVDVLGYAWMNYSLCIHPAVCVVILLSMKMKYRCTVSPFRVFFCRVPVLSAIANFAVLDYPTGQPLSHGPCTAVARKACPLILLLNRRHLLAHRRRLTSSSGLEQPLPRPTRLLKPAGSNRRQLRRVAFA